MDAPSGFRGRFTRDPGTRQAFSVASGPFAIPPEAVATPADVADIRTILRWAAATGTSLVSRGAGTGMPGGNVGRGVVVDLGTHFRSLDPVDPVTRTVRTDAGVTLGSIDAVAREHGLFLPPLPSSADRATVGGAVANNSAGARTFGYGAMREWVAALTLVRADGSVERLERGPSESATARNLAGVLAAESDDLLQAWPRVRKNSSGYALDRFLPAGDALQLMVGSEGTLGIITEATFELAALPPSVALAVISVTDLDAVPLLAHEARAAGATACEFFGHRFLRLADTAAVFEDAVEDAVGLMLIEVSGSPSEIASSLDALGTVAAKLGCRARAATDASDRSRAWGVRHGASPAIARAAAQGVVSTQFIEDCVVPVDRVPDFVRGIEGILAEARFDHVLFGHAGDGNLHVNPLVPSGERDALLRARRVLDRTTDLVAALGGTLSGEHGDGRLRAPLLERIWSPAQVSAFEAVKEAYDPERVLNPGVILPRPGQDPLEGLWGLADPAPAGAGPT